MTHFPITHTDYKSAVKEARELSVKNKTIIVYLYRKGEGGYVIDYQAGEFTNEKLVHKFLNGLAI